MSTMNLNNTDEFSSRHIGPNTRETKKMLEVMGLDSIETLIGETVPAGIRRTAPLQLPAALSEFQYLQELRQTASLNKVFKSYIGLGYYNSITPAVIRRNILENPGWYTQYTPYQAEIAQGRLEALLNFQTMICDLTAMPIANASLLDEGTAAAEAMNMFFHTKNKKGTEYNKIFVSEECFPQTIDVIKTRAMPLGIEVVVGSHESVEIDISYFAVVLQYPAKSGAIIDYKKIVDAIHQVNGYVVVAADLMSLALLTPPGEWGADCVVGNSQRFGVPMGYGGPHAAYFATTEEFKRILPGRIIGVSIDRNNNRALRMALQTREQHIRREKATSNICTAQALLAIMASMYAVYHGQEGVKNIATRIHGLTQTLAEQLQQAGIKVLTNHYFDTITIESAAVAAIQQRALAAQMNFNYGAGTIGISLDETTQVADISAIVAVITGKEAMAIDHERAMNNLSIPTSHIRKSAILNNDIFNSFHSESRMLRYIKSLEDKDLSLTKSMIALGSCTMKLNATAELEPISWAEFAHIHPFAPLDQAAGYQKMIHELESYLNEITGFDATSLQPNSGAQGEYAGLMVIRAYQKDKGEAHRNVILIPSSAHGTNPASAAMSGASIVVTACDDQGNIDVADLKAKAEQYKDNLCALMVTYPSTHGVFEGSIKEVCQIIHDNGGQVYMDGANMNAQVGLTSPGLIGADVCHLNLHKTFAIPHGGGGPGMGPICVKGHLAPFLPGNPVVKTGGDKAIHAISAAPWGSASILLISYGYIKMLGSAGVTAATEYAILNANYIKERLGKAYDVLYVGKDYGRVAHELILDFRPFKHSLNVEVEDIAKRLMDYGFHAPTVSFPVAGTLMIEPTESEDLMELDRFCDAMLAIREEIREVENGADKNNNVLKNAPHTLGDCFNEAWSFPYSKEKAAFPLPYIRTAKFWPSVAKVNSSYGDRNLVCTCAPIEAYMDQPVEA